MSIIKSKHSSNFTVLPNEIFKQNLSIESVGLLAYLLSLPHDWVIYKTQLPSIIKCGREKSARMFKELENAGYVLSVEHRNEQGKIHYEHIIYDKPYNGEPSTGLPYTGQPSTAKQALLNKQLTKETNTKETIQNIPFSESVLDCYEKCIIHFKGLEPEPKQRDKWLKCIQDLNHIDKRPFEEIQRIVKAARNDQFWKQNFLSILKLRNKNKNEVTYYNVFKAKWPETPVKKPNNSHLFTS